jgi:polyferredoxin
MSSVIKQTKVSARSFSYSVSFCALLFLFLAAFSLLSARDLGPLFFVKLLWSLVIAAFGFAIIRSGVISGYRSALFILIAFLFFLEFKFFRWLSIANTIPPYCHIAQAPTLFNFLHSQFLAFTSGDWKIWGVLTLGFLWLLIMFTIGQGICSWVCFYGGMDEFFSKVLNKPVIRLNIPKKGRDFPLAFLIFLLIISFLQGSPIFCSWFCPLKLTCAFWDHEPTIRMAQAVLFYLILFGFVILLPVLSKKRTFCSMICPFGALVSICGKVSPYQVKIDQEKCIHCGKCFDVCPVFAVERKDPQEYRISSYCNKCGACIDVCPVDAIPLSAWDSLTGWRLQIRDIFLFLSLLMTGVLSSSFVARVVLQLLGVK